MTSSTFELTFFCKDLGPKVMDNNVGEYMDMWALNWRYYEIGIGRRASTAQFVD